MMNDKLIRIGVISAVYPETATARVIFPDRDDMTSKDLPLIFMRAFGVEVYSMPAVGEEVLCTFLGNGWEEGFILGGYYNDKNTPPSSSGSSTLIKFPSGDYIEYDGSKFIISGNVTVNGSVTATEFIGNLTGLADGVK